jgi:outer membrane autotransporter protein
LTYTRSSLDDFATDGGIVSSGTDTSLVGRAGAQMGYLMPVTNTFFLQPYAGVSYWKNFQNESDLVFKPTAGAQLSSTTKSAEDYVQFVGGLAFAETSSNIVGYLQGAWREGDDISGGTITAGGRINF